jgi:hypothetical protein
LLHPPVSAVRALAPLSFLTKAWPSALCAAVLVAGSGVAFAGPVPLAPQYAGSFATGTGSDARFVRIDNDWRGSTVLWNEDQGRFGDGEPIGSFPWGTGLWGRADWNQVQAAANGPGPSAVPIAQQFDGQIDRINFGNARYNECYADTWGTVELRPFFTTSPALGDCDDPEAGDPVQQNWIAEFSGFIRIAEAGLYNFSVLYDDGFFFRLVGEGGEALEIGQDYLNPRDREGFDDDLALLPGLYGFELGAWNRLGAGVVDLRWSLNGDPWTLVPTENLLPGSAVPEPGGPGLILLALGLAMAARRRSRVGIFRHTQG